MFARPLEIREQATTWGTWPGDVVPAWSSGPAVTSANAMQLLAVYGSATLITDEISTLPVEADRQSWITQPTMDLDRLSWLSQICLSLLLDGNSYLDVTRSSSGQILEMIPRPDGWVRPQRINGRLVFIVNGSPYPGEIIHIKGIMRAGSEVGLSPVENARLTIGIGQSAAKFGAQQFDNELNMPGVIEIPKPMQPGKLKETAELWQRKRRTGGKGLPGVLDDGATWRATGVTNEQAQFLATRQFTDAQIAGQMFKLDPSDLGIAVQGTSLTYANLAQRNTRRVQVTLMPWIRRIESALSPYVIDGQYKFNVDARLRGDTKESYETLAIAKDNEFLDLSEIRTILNLPPVQPSTKPTTFTEKVEMVGQLIRAGFEAEASCVAVGLPQIPHTGLTPVTVTEPKSAPAANPTEVPNAPAQ